MGDELRGGESEEKIVRGLGEVRFKESFPRLNCQPQYGGKAGIIVQRSEGFGGGVQRIRAGSGDGGEKGKRRVFFLPDK